MRGIWSKEELYIYQRASQHIHKNIEFGFTSPEEELKTSDDCKTGKTVKNKTFTETSTWKMQLEI